MLNVGSIQALCEKGLLGEEDLAAAELQRLKEEVLDLFLWENAQFEFTENLLPSEFRSNAPGATKISFRTDRLLFDAMSRLAEWEEIVKALRSSKAIFAFASTEAKQAALGASDCPELLYLFDGVHSLGDVVKDAGKSRFEVYRLARKLLEAGTLAYHGHKAVSGRVARPTIARLDRLLIAPDGKIERQMRETPPPAKA